MFLKAGALSLALLLASRLLGLARESAQAAAFGATGMGDVAVLMLTFPDWLTGLLASGALAYVLLPAWANEEGARIAASQRRVARALLAGGLAVALALALLHQPAVAVLAAGLPPGLRGPAGAGLAWSGVAVPLALLAALWVTRLQHERDFVGMYAASMVVNVFLVTSLFLAGAMGTGPHRSVLLLGLGLLLAMVARLAWLQWRQRPFRGAPAPAAEVSLPRASVWVWAIAAAGLPVALPFAARSLASEQAAGALVVFNYAWKLVELPLVLAVQLVGTLALGPIAQALRSAAPAAEQAIPMRRGFALAWTLACASAAGLVVAAPAIAQILFGWGRMQPEALQQVAEWGRIGSWSLLPQALLTIGLAVLAAQTRMHGAVLAHALALVALLASGSHDGGVLMVWLDVLWAAICAAVLWAIGPDLKAWLPWRAIGAAGLALLAVHAVLRFGGAPGSTAWQLVGAIVAALGVIAAAMLASPDVRAALRR
jgi:putative peptidoglycan lipid II flippase